MKHLRSDYDSIQPFPSPRAKQVRIDGESVLVDDSHLGLHMDPIIPDDEPVFILRAKDILAPSLIRVWAQGLEAMGGDQDLADRVVLFANEMQEYAAEHYGGGKVPDTPAGSLR